MNINDINYSMPFCTWTVFGSAIGSLIAIVLISQIYTFQVATKISHRNGLPRISSRDVFGIGLLGTIAQQMKIDRVFEWASDMLNVPGRTVDMTLFRLRFIWTDAPENTHALLSSQFSDYGKGDFVHKLLGNLGEGLLVTVDGADWRAKRKELRPHLSTLSEKDREITELHLRPLLERLSQSQAPIDVFDVIDKLQLDIAIHRFVGQLTDADEAGYQRFRKAKRTLAAAGTMRPFLGPLGFLVKPIERTARGDLDIYVQKLLQAADHSIFAKSEAEIEHRRELLLNLILAGKDPTVVTITWAIYELSRNPDVLKKLRLEIADIIGYEQLPSLSSLDRMPYLNNVIRETLRLYPPTGFNFREALRNTTLPRGGGADGREPVAVKKGEVVVFSSFGLQRRPEYVGPDANYWRPERWEHWTPPEGSYIPWGTGPRTCLGKAFGQFQVAYTLVRLFQEFDSVAEVSHGKNTEQRIRLEVLAKPAMTISCRFNRGDQLR